MEELKDDYKVLWENESEICFSMTDPDTGEYITIIRSK